MSDDIKYEPSEVNPNTSSAESLVEISENNSELSDIDASMDISDEEFSAEIEILDNDNIVLATTPEQNFSADDLSVSEDKISADVALIEAPSLTLSDDLESFQNSLDVDECEPLDAEPLVEDLALDQDLSLEMQLEEIESLHSEMSQLSNSLSEQTAHWENRVRQLTELHDGMEAWVQERKGSYAWKLHESIIFQAEKAKLDEDTIRNWATQPVAADLEEGNLARKKFRRRLTRGALVGLVLFGLLLLTRNKLAIATGVTILATSTILMLAIYFAIGYLLHSFSSIFLFFRKWSVAHAALKLELNYGRQLADAIDKCRRERIRLGALESQAPQFLEVIASGVHKPWTVSDSLLAFQGSAPSLDYLPASLEFAVPSEKHRGEIAELERKGLISLIRPGWRLQAYRNLVEAVAEHLGSNKSLTLDSIDADSGRDGARGVFLKNVGNSDVRENVGIRMARSLAREIQKDVLPSVKPSVEVIRPDILAGLELGSEILEDPDLGLIEWDDFLGMVLAPGSKWSPLVASAGGGHAVGQDDAGTTFFVPESLKGKALEAISLSGGSISENDASNMVFVLKPPGVRPMDISIRVDQSGWLLPEDVAAFTGRSAPMDSDNRPVNRLEMSGD